MRRLILAAVLVLVAVVALPGQALGHAELVTADPADGAEVEGPVFPIILTFSLPLADGSKAEVVKAGESTVVLTILPDPTNPTRMGYAPTSGSQQFAPGDYEIRWTSVADDGDLLRGTSTFTVTAPPATPTPLPPSPSLSGVPFITPDPAETESPLPTAPPGDGPGDSSAVIFPIVVGLVLVGVAAVWLLRRRPSAP